MLDKQRRSFLSSFFRETCSIVEEFRGIQQFRLDELKSVPSDILNNLVPVFNTGKPSKIENNSLLVQQEKDGDYILYCELKSRDLYILDCFDGLHSINGICNCLVIEFQMEFEAAFTLVRSLFIRLSEDGICHPAGGHE